MQKIISNNYFFENLLKQKRHTLTMLYIYLVGFVVPVVAQINLSIPANRQVYQRNKQNTATVHVGGSFTGQLDRVEARTTLLDGKGLPKSPLQQSAWQIVANSPTAGNFVGSLNNVKAGWYQLQVRAIQNGQVIGDTSTIKVGVGEVFAIAGQSNARGDLPINNPILYGAEDDRVNSIDLNNFTVNSQLKYPVFTHLDPRSMIAPTGGCSWVWGPMGDQIAKNWDVPVVFYNAAVGNTSVFEWRAGANYENTTFNTTNHSEGWPYVFLRKTLQYYVSFTGIRAVLWHQGETDTGIFNAAALPPEFYRDNLLQVINKSRSESEKDLSWVIARASFAEGNTSFRVLDGQQQVASQPNYNTFAGPNTDLIQPSVSLRDAGGAHFMGDGLVQVGQAWFNSINNSNFLNNSTPYAASTPQKIQAGSCVDNSQVAFKMPDGNTEYAWYSDDYKTYDVGQIYKAQAKKTLVPYLRDANRKNYIVLPQIAFNSASLNIQTNRSPVLCEGQTLELTASAFNNNYLWNTGQTTKSIVIDKAGDYNLSLTSKDIFGCTANATKLVTVSINPLPVTPIIVAEGSASICLGANVNLKASNEPPNINYLWSDGTKANFLNSSKNGTFSLKWIDNNKCESKLSNAITVQVNPVPERPEIQAGGNTTFCQGKDISLAITANTSYKWYRNGQNIQNLNTQFIKASLPGSYQGAVLNSFGCESLLSPSIEIKNYILPSPPSIVKSDVTAFCAGGSVNLSAQSSLSNINWYKNSEASSFLAGGQLQITSQSSVNNNIDTQYYATVTDQQSCESLPSEKITVSIRANPSTFRVEQAGSFTLEAKTNIFGIAGTSYDWYRNNQKVATTADVAYKTSQSGSYSVIPQINYTLPGATTLNCRANASEKYVFEAPTNELFMVHRNPSTDGYFTLEARDDYTGVIVQVLSPMGVLLFNQLVDNFNDRHLLNLSNLANGPYKLRFIVGDTVVIKNLVIRK
jgi:hypothetical protein